VSFNGAPISVREAAPCNEAHHVVIVEQKNGRTLTTQRAYDRSERCIIDLLRRIGILQALRKGEQGGLFVLPTSEPLLGYLAVADVMLDAHGIQKMPPEVADAGRCYGGPEKIAVLAVNSLFDAVAFDLAPELPLELRAICFYVFRQGFLKYRPAQQLRGRIAGQHAKVIIDPQHSSIGVDLHNSRADMLIGGG
jgi:hypothetical protein